MNGSGKGLPECAVRQGQLSRLGTGQILAIRRKGSCRTQTGGADFEAQVLAGAHGYSKVCIHGGLFMVNGCLKHKKSGRLADKSAPS